MESLVKARYPGLAPAKKQAFPLLLACLTLFISCTMPRIIILDDPLTAEQHNDLGVVYKTKGKYELAEKEYAKAIKLKKNWMPPYFNMGNLYYKTGRYPQAESYFRQALERNADDPDVMNNLANALLAQDKHDEAAALIRKAIKINPREEYLDTQRKITEKDPRELHLLPDSLN